MSERAYAGFSELEEEDLEAGNLDQFAVVNGNEVNGWVVMRDDAGNRLNSTASQMAYLYIRPAIGRRPATAVLEFFNQDFSATFTDTSEIEHAGLRGLANAMLDVWAKVSQRAEAARAEKEALVIATARATIANSVPWTNHDLPLRIERAAVRVRLEDHSVAFETDFVRLADSSWASDAILRVARGRRGRNVYPEAIHLPSSATLPRDIWVTEEHLREFLPQHEARIIGVDGYDPLVAVRCDPLLGDRSYVTVAKAHETAARLASAIAAP